MSIGLIFLKLTKLMLASLPGAYDKWAPALKADRPWKECLSKSLFEKVFTQPG